MPHPQNNYYTGTLPNRLAKNVQNYDEQEPIANPMNMQQIRKAARNTVYGVPFLDQQKTTTMIV